MTKGIVTCNLHKRRGKPSVNAEKLGHFKSGSKIEIIDVVLGHTENDYYEGTPTWYKLADEIYVWSGGVSLNLNEQVFKKKIFLDKRTIEKGISSRQKIELRKTAQLKTPIPPNDGAGVNVAVLDSGIDSGHIHLTSAIIKKKNYQKDKKNHPHGVKVAGIMAANDMEVEGLSKAINILDLRVADDHGNTNDAAVKKALEDILAWNKSTTDPTTHIINMSLDVSSSMITQLKTIVSNLTNSGVVIVVAGNEVSIDNNLAELNNVFPVGVFESFELADLKKNGLSSNIKISYLNEPILTTSSLTSHEDFADSSAYTAFTSGLIATYLSSNSNINPTQRLSKVSAFLTGISQSIQPNINKLESFKPYI